MKRTSEVNKALKIFELVCVLTFSLFINLGVSLEPQGEIMTTSIK